jgi:hypothetical protein
MTYRDPSRANIAIPKLFSIVMGKAPQVVRALAGRRPYLPFEASREEYQDDADLMSKMLDTILAGSGYKLELTLASLINMVFGWSYMEPLPYYKTIHQAVLVPDMSEGPYGPEITGFHKEYQPTQRLRFRMTPMAPWDVITHENATTLREQGGCRWVIKTRIVSRKDMKRLAASGFYGPDFDADKIDSKHFVDDLHDHEGLEILSSMGYNAPPNDGDTTILWRFESEERYVDRLGKYLILRDRDNPFAADQGGHGLINLCKMTHNLNPHTQNRWRGNGEAKINEVLISVLNENISATLDNVNMKSQGVTYYATGRGVEPEDLVMSVGNKIGFRLESGENIEDLVKESFGSSLPDDHHIMREVIERYIDLGAQWYEVNRGEKVPGDPTLGEVGMLKAAGEAPLEMTVSVLEEEFLKDLGNKCLSHIEQFATMEDRVEILGQEDAVRTMMLHPQDLPGGYNFTFRGSDRVVNQALRRRDMQTLHDRIIGIPWLDQRSWLVELLKTHDLDDVAEDVVYSEEEFAQMAGGGAPMAPPGMPGDPAAGGVGLSGDMQLPPGGDVPLQQENARLEGGQQ